MVRGFRDSGDLDARIGPLQIQPLTDDQTRFVKDLFQKYVPEEMSAEDAVEIIDALVALEYAAGRASAGANCRA
jgi:hypothetical protein